VRGNGHQLLTDLGVNNEKVVPDPPTKTSPRAFYSINNDMPSPEALLYVSQLLRGIEDTLDEYTAAMPAGLA